MKKKPDVPWEDDIYEQATLVHEWALRTDNIPVRILNMMENIRYSLAPKPKKAAAVPVATKKGAKKRK